jgi:hypothetical protein
MSKGLVTEYRVIMMVLRTAPGDRNDPGMTR